MTPADLNSSAHGDTPSPTGRVPCPGVSRVSGVSGVSRVPPVPRPAQSRKPRVSRVTEAEA